jgi:hypothetical protein
MNTDTVGNPGRLQKRSRRAVNEILSVRRQRRVVAREFDAVRVALESQPVTDIDRMQDGFQFMKTIGASSEDVQEQINFARRFFFEAHGVLQKTKRANGNLLAR